MQNNSLIMHFTPKICPNTLCAFNQLGTQTHFIKKGFHRVRRLNQKFRKFQCKNCSRYFSSRTFKADYKHKKMDLNKLFAKALVEGNSLRGISRILGLTYNNTYKKFLWFKKLIKAQQEELRYSATELQFDELETIHHTKCKPLSLILVINEKRQLLAAKVAEIPAKGKLAAFSRLKYGLRKNEREQKIKEAFTEVKAKLYDSPEIIKSDAHPIYKKIVTEYFPSVSYLQYSRRANKNKLQERLHEKQQKKKFDYLFGINHKCAVLRDRTKRLVRRNWCTTKKPENLQLQLDLFVMMSFGIVF